MNDLIRVSRALMFLHARASFQKIPCFEFFVLTFFDLQNAENADYFEGFCENEPEVRFDTLASILAPFWRAEQDLKTLIFAAEDDQPALLCSDDFQAAVLSGNERRKTKFQIFAKLKNVKF